MSKDKFKQFLEGMRTDENKKLMETIIGGYAHLFEADKGDEIDEEVDDSEEEMDATNVPEEVSEVNEEVPEVPEGVPSEITEITPEVTPETPENVPETSENGQNPLQLLIDGLNGDLSREYSAAIQYIQHASVLTGAQYISISKEMLVHADEEMGHAKELANKIDYIGGVPVVEITPAKTSTDPLEMIAQDKASEEEAIQRYKERIKQAEDAGEVAIKQMLIEILSDEEEHRNDLMVALGE